MVVVAGRELRDLWIGGRGLLLAFAFSVLLSAITYLGATNEALNFLERREAVNLTLQVAVGVGALLALLAAADAISGERERGTLESLLLTPVAREGLVAGKLVAALSLWFGALLLTVPYVWFLGHDVGAAGEAIGTGALAGTLLAVGLTAFGIVVSALADSNRISLSVSLFTLLALFAPTQLPAGAARLGGGGAAARQPGDRSRALRGRRRGRPAPLDAGPRLARLAVDRGGRADGRCGRRHAALPAPARGCGRMIARRLPGAAVCALAAALVVAGPAAAAPKLPDEPWARRHPHRHGLPLHAPRSPTPAPCRWRASSPT